LSEWTCCLLTQRWKLSKGCRLYDGTSSIRSFKLESSKPSSRRPLERLAAGMKGAKRGPSLVMKCLQASLSPSFHELLKEHFGVVRWEKPTSGRPESREGYWVCADLKERNREREEAEGEDEEGEPVFFYVTERDDVEAASPTRCSLASFLEPSLTFLRTTCFSVLALVEI
jgi:hypothetical protein